MISNEVTSLAGLTPLVCTQVGIPVGLTWSSTGYVLPIVGNILLFDVPLLA